MQVTKYFPDFKSKAFTLSFDDAVVQDRRIIELFKKYQLKATFNINSGLFDVVWVLKYDNKTQDHIRISAKEAVTLYKGFEVAGHTVTHPSLTYLDFDAIKSEVINDKMTLEELFRTDVRGLAYPGGAFDKRTADILRELGIWYARTIEATNSFKLPADFLQWHPTCHYSNAFKFADKFINSKKKDLQLFYVWGHSYELDRKKDDWESFECFCAAISNKADIWYAENIEICDYINALNVLEFEGEKPVNNSGIQLYLEIENKKVIV